MAAGVTSGFPAMGRVRFYLGLFLVTAATLMLQIVETRIVSVTSWYHLAFFVISIAMFGLTAGAVWVHQRRATLTPARLSYDLTVAALGFALGTVLALLVQTTLATGLSASLTGLLVWAELAACLAVPFFFSGVVVSLALTRSPYPIGEVYGADLLGAAAGCLGVLAVLDLASGPSAVLWTGVLAAAAALLFAGSGLGAVPAGRDGLGRRLFRRRGLVLAGLLALAVANELTGHGIRPLLVKGRLETPGAFAFEGWNSFSRITATESAEVPPALWGPSPRMPEYRIGQRWLTIDGDAGTGMYRFGGDLEELSFLRYDVTNLAYAVPGLGTGAVIGVGGGRDVLSARLFGVGEVTGVELNPIFVDLLTRRFADYTAIAAVPGVAFEVDEARSWFARTDRTFDIVQMSLIDTWAATGAGAFTLSENGLYTVEAWRIFLDRLNPGGVFTVSRWHAEGDADETGRMVSLAAATLLELGAAEPDRHLFLATAGRIATLVVGREPLAPAAVEALEAAAAALDFRVLLGPSRPAASPMLRAIAGAPDRAALAAAVGGHPLDLSPPTDARPFFFNQLRFDRLLAGGLPGWSAAGVLAGNLAATLNLAMLVLTSAVLVAATIVLPLRATVRDAGWRLAIGGTAYFALIGVGLHDGRDRAAAADERLPRPPGPRAQRRPVQPDPRGRARQPGLGAAAAGPPGPARGLGGAHGRLPVPAADLAAAAAAAARRGRAAGAGGPLRAGAGPGRLPDGLRLPDRDAACVPGRRGPDPLVLGDQRRRGRARGEPGGAHEPGLRDRPDAAGRGGVLPAAAGAGAAAGLPGARAYAPGSPAG
jgi:hypothetical protein